MRVLSELQAGPLSDPLLDVRRRGGALPSPGTTHRSVTSFCGSYDGSDTLKTTHLPSGDGTGAPTR